MTALASSLARAARRLGAAALLAGLSQPAGCVSAPTQKPVEVPKPAVPDVVPVADGEFAAAVVDVLQRKSISPKVRGVVERQLAHAGRRFVFGHRDEATVAALGALSLLSPADAPMLPVRDPLAIQGLLAAVEQVSQRGDEGRSRVLLELVKGSAAAGSPEATRATEHLAALDRWLTDTLTGAPIVRAGRMQERTLARVLLDPSKAATKDAEAAAFEWLRGVTQVNRTFQRTRQRPERAVSIEAIRGMQAGGLALAAVHLRSGDAVGALRALEHEDASDLVPDELKAAVRAASRATATDARAWIQLAGFYDEQRSQNDPSDVTASNDVYKAVLWGASCEAYRRDPKNKDAAFLVAQQLAMAGMVEASVALLAGSLDAKTSADALSQAVLLAQFGIESELALDDLDSARRTFAAAQPLLALAEASRVPVTPTASDLRFSLGTGELRNGNLAEARALLEKAVQAEPLLPRLLVMASLERQAGNAPASIAWAEKALRAPDSGTSLLGPVEAQLFLFDTHRDAGDLVRAQVALDAALTTVLGAKRGRLVPSEMARVEQALGRVLDGYGESAGAARAYDRALAVASTDRRALSAAVVETVLRATARKDLAAARRALKTGLDANLDPDDLVYAGLWVHLLEREQRAQPDGLAERGLRAAPRGTWVAKLVAWANGKLGDAELAQAAANPIQKLEAEFYAAMGKLVAGDGAGKARLQAVAKSGLPVLEVELARVFGADSRPTLKLPAGTVVP
jgi:hypothetical protein